MIYFNYLNVKYNSRYQLSEGYCIFGLKTLLKGSNYDIRMDKLLNKEVFLKAVCNF